MVKYFPMGKNETRGHKSMTSHNKLACPHRAKDSRLEDAATFLLRCRSTKTSYTWQLNRHDTNSVQRDQRRRYANTRNLALPYKLAARIMQRPI